MDAVVGHTVLREVVRPNLLRALARPDLRTARRCELGLLLLALVLVEPRSKHAHRLRLVLELRLLVLHRDDGAGGNVRDAHGGVGRVHALAARPGRAVDVDLQVVLVDLHFDLFGLRHHRDRRSGCVDASLRLGLGNALHAVRAAFPLEDRVRAVALDGDRHLLDAAELVRRAAERLGLPAATLRIARQHPQHLGCPERRLVAPDPLANLEDHVLAVGGVGLDERELQIGLEALRLESEVLQETRQLRVVLRVLEITHHLAPALRQLVRGFELLQPAARVGRLAMVVVDRRIGHALLRLAVLALELVDQRVDRHRAQAMTSTRRASAGRSCPSSRSTSRSARIETSSWSSEGSRVVSRCSHRPGASSVIRSLLSVCLPAKRITSYARPAITGSSRMRLAISQGHEGWPMKAKTKIAITITQRRNAVPQRGWINEKRWTFSGVSSSPASSALIALCSAPWYWKTRRRSGSSEIT